MNTFSFETKSLSLSTQTVPESWRLCSVKRPSRYGTRRGGVSAPVEWSGTRTGDPENYVLLLWRKVFIRSKYTTNEYIKFWKQNHCFWALERYLKADGCALWSVQVDTERATKEFQLRWNDPELIRDEQQHRHCGAARAEVRDSHVDRHHVPRRELCHGHLRLWCCCFHSSTRPFLWRGFYWRVYRKCGWLPRTWLRCRGDSDRQVGVGKGDVWQAMAEGVQRLIFPEDSE